MPGQKPLASLGTDEKCARCWHDMGEHEDGRAACAHLSYSWGAYPAEACPCPEYLSPQGAGSEVEAYRG